MSHDPILLAKTEMYTQTWYPDLLPASPAYCELFQNSLTWILYNLFHFYFASVPTFVECVAAVKN